MVDGDNTITFTKPLTVEANQSVYFRFTGAVGTGSQTQISLRGDAQQEIYYKLDITELEEKTVTVIGVESVVAGNKIFVDDSDPKNPIVSWDPSSDLLPGVNIDKEGVQVLSAADTLNFSSAFNVTKAKDTGGTVNIELSTTARGTNEVGVFESTTDLLAAYPTPEDGLYARVLQDNNNLPDDRYESKGGNWVGMGGVAGQVIVDDNKSLGLIMGDGLKAEDDGGSAKISLDGNTPVLTFDVTTDSTRSVDTSYVGKIISIIQTPPSISIPMQITLVDHSQFKTGDTIKIAADRDGDNAYKNYYFAVYFNDASGRNIAKYPANNITMVRTDTAWDVQLDGRFTNVSIRPKSEFNIPYAPDEQYNTPVNAFVFAESPSVEFQIDEDTNTRIVKVDLDSVTNNYIAKYSRADTDYVQVAYQGKYEEGRVYYPATLKQDVNGWTQSEFTGNLVFKSKNMDTGEVGDKILELQAAKVVHKKQPYYGDNKLATKASNNISNAASFNDVITTGGKSVSQWISENPSYTPSQLLDVVFDSKVLGETNWIVSLTASSNTYNGTIPSGFSQWELHKTGGAARDFMRVYHKESHTIYFAPYKAGKDPVWKKYGWQEDISTEIDDKISADKAKGIWIGGVIKDTLNDASHTGDQFDCGNPKHYIEFRKTNVVRQRTAVESLNVTVHLHPDSGLSKQKFRFTTSDGLYQEKNIRIGEKWRFYLRRGVYPYFEKIDDGTSSYVSETELNFAIEENNDEIITPNKGEQFQIVDSDKSSSYGNASKKVTYFQPAVGTQSAMLLSNLDYGKAFAIHEEVNSTKLIMILHESLVAEIYNRDLTGVNELTMLFTGDSRGRLSKANQTADAQFAINWNGELIPATEDANELNPTMWVAQDDSVTENWSTSVKSVCYSSGVLANRGSAMLKRGDVIYSKPESLADSNEPLTENPRSLSQTLSDSGETATITYDNDSEFFVMPIIAGGGTFSVMKVFQLFMSRKYQTMNEWGSFKFDESSDCLGTILKIAYDAAIAEEEKQEQAENDNLIEGLAQGFIYANNVTVG